MKKFILIILMIAIFMIGCTDSKGNASFDLTAENLNVEINEFAELPLELSNIKLTELDFVFSTVGIVSLQGTHLIPESYGSTVLTITYKDVSKNLNIKVTPELPKVRLSGNYLEVGTTTRVDVTNFEHNSDFNWVIADESIISLTTNDKMYYLNALKIGSTTLTVTLKTNPDITRTITVEIWEKKPDLEAPLSLLKVGDKTQLTITNLDNKTLADYTWEVSDESIARLDENYELTALKEGKVVITITSKTNTLVNDTFEVTITTPDFELNSKGEPNKGPLFLIPGNVSATVQAGEAIEVKIYEGKNNYNYRWRPLDPTVVAATDQGVVWGVKEGRTTLIVWSKDDDTIKGEIDITVVGTPNVNYRERIVTAALSQEGYKQGPNKSNKFGDWFMYNNVDWCAIFVSWSVNQAGIGIDVVPKFALVADGVRWFSNKNQYEVSGGTYQPQRGDIIFFQNLDDTTPSHVGIVTGSDNTYVYTIEGNTSGGVHQRQYTLTNPYVIGYGIPAYPPFNN